MATEKFANNALTNLAATIGSAGQTNLTVQSAAGFPPGAQFRIKIEQELMLVTAGGNLTTNWTVVRGIEGTTATPHPLGATVAHVVTTGGLKQYISDNATTGGGDISAVTSERPGRLYFTNPGYFIDRDTGTGWEGYGPIYPFVLPRISDFTLVNGGSATIDQVYGSVHLSVPAQGSDAARMIVQPVPVASTWTLRVACGTSAIVSQVANQLWQAGLVLRNSSTGALLTGNIFEQSAGPATYPVYYVESRSWTDASTPGAQHGQIYPSRPGYLYWLQVQKTASNFVFGWSPNGRHYFTVATVPLAIISPDQVGLFYNENSNTGGSVELLCWQVS